MKNNRYDIVICGAGIAGISSAFYLSENYGINDILIVDQHPPLSLTSDKSTECYRNWWPGPDDAMVRMMNRSIDLLEDLAIETNNVFQLNRRGYLYASGDSTQINEFMRNSKETSKLGAGPLRIHRNRVDDPDYLRYPSCDLIDTPIGADLFLDPNQILRHFPYLTKKVEVAMHVRRAGWFSAQQLGMYLFNVARTNGVKFIQNKIVGTKIINNKIASINLANGDEIRTEAFINASGPFLKPVGKMLGVDIPVYCELHQKATFKDYLGVIPRDAPLLIWTDPQTIEWSEEENKILTDDQDSHWLLDELPAGVHTRPEGGHDSQIALLLWEYRTNKVDPVFPPHTDPIYPELAIRGLATLLPGLKAYFKKLPRFTLDGGYYTKTIENRPLICPLPISGAFVIGALSGFGLMSACAAGELIAAHITQSDLPDYAPSFDLKRYSDPAYLSKLENWGDTGQL